MRGQARAAALTLTGQHQLKNVVPNSVFLATLIGRCWLCSSYSVFWGRRNCPAKRFRPGPGRAFASQERSEQSSRSSQFTAADGEA